MTTYAIRFTFNSEDSSEASEALRQDTEPTPVIYYKMDPQFFELTEDGKWSFLANEPGLST